MKRIAGMSLAPFVLLLWGATNAPILASADVLTREEAWRIGWPCWSGPFQNFRAVACGHKLVVDLRQAKLVWQSEEVTPIAKAFSSQSGQYAGGRHGKTQKGCYPGGGASPVVADGRVLFSYYLPADDSPWVEPTHRARWTRRPLLAKDVVLCVDAYGGKTLWKKEFPGGPFSISMKGAGTSGLSPCVSEGRLYTFFTGHALRALDVETGNVIWEAPLPGYGEKTKAYREAARALPRPVTAEAVAALPDLRSIHFGKREGQNLVCIGGVVLVEGLLAFDAGTGELLWQKRMRGYPVRWSAGDRELILMGGDNPILKGQPVRDSQMACIEPKTGEVIWTEPFGGVPEDTMLGVEGDLVAGRAPGVRFKDERGRDSRYGLLALWRLDLKGATLLWRHDEKAGFKIHPKNQPLIIDGLVYCGVEDPPKQPYPVACFDGRTGKRLGTIDVPSGRRPGNILRVEDRLLILGDASHSNNTAFWAWAGGRRFDVSGEPWRNPHPPTTPLYATITWPYVDGLLYMRGADGIYCYDLRRPGDN
jgi:outer membrane protein assembly factor BamB